MKKIITILPGFITALLITTAGVLFTKFVYPSPGGVTFAILGGILFGNISYKKLNMAPGATFLEKKILPFSIVLLGSQLNFIMLKELGMSTIFFIICYIVIVLVINIILSFIFRYSFKQGLLLGIGNAICGSSAIAASKDVIEPEADEVGLSVAAVNLAGVAGIFLMPLVARVVGYNEAETSSLIGGTLQAISQTAASGYAVSQEVGNLALIVKMERVAMLGPLVLILTLVTRFISMKKSGQVVTADESAEVAVGEVAAAGRVRGFFNKIFRFVPPFIIGFMLMAVLTNTGVFSQPLTKSIQTSGKLLLTFAMAGLGMRINFRSLISKGSKVIAAQVVAIVLQTGVAMLLIKLFIS